MTPEQQRIKIAEACGYIGPFETSEEWHDEGEGAFQAAILRDSLSRQVPDYLADLNAMHQAEKVLTAEQRGEFPDYLPYDSNTARPTYHATAAQRAEAFLRTIGKWEGQP